MSTMPPQLSWRRFICLRCDLGHRPLKSRRESRRQFLCPTRSPILVSFREPRSGDVLINKPLNDCLHNFRLTARGRVCAAAWEH